MKIPTENITFKNLFKDIVNEGENILIEYDNSLFGYDDQSYINFKIISVNGCETEHQFKKKLQGQLKNSIQLLISHIKSIQKDKKIDVLNYIKDELIKLTCLIYDEIQVYEKSEYGDREEHHFKTFVNPSFKGPEGDKLDHYKKSIMRNAENYAEIWLEVIDEAKQKVNFLINQIELLQNGVSDSKPKKDKNMENVHSKPTVFISYSHQDSDYLIRLRVHLRPLEKNNTIDVWDDSRIKSGDKWKDEITNALEKAKIAILLISADFLASDFIVDNELPPLLKGAEKKGTVIIPVIVKTCGFLRDKNLSQFQAINKPEKALQIISEPDKEAIYDKISARIGEVIS